MTKAQRISQYHTSELNDKRIGDLEVNENTDLTAGEIMVYYINEKECGNCPHVEVVFGNESVSCILDTGAEKSIIAEGFYHRLIESGLPTLQLPVENVVLITAFGSKTRRVTKQMYVEFSIGEDNFEHVFLICPQLVNSVILGSDFAVEYGLTIDFDERCFSFGKGEDRKIHKFKETKENGQTINEELPLGTSFQDSRSTICNHLISCSEDKGKLPREFKDVQLVTDRHIVTKGLQVFPIALMMILRSVMPRVTAR
jgi:hypothetical protein